MALGADAEHYHVGIVTRDLDEAMATVGAALGLSWGEVIDGSSVPLLSDDDGPVAWRLRRVVHSLGGPMRAELLEGGPGSIWACDRAAELHHLAYWVDDVTATAGRLRSQGWALEVTAADEHGRPSMFAYLARDGEARIEITDRSLRAATLARLGWHPTA